MALSTLSFIDLEYFNLMSKSSIVADTDEESNFNNIANFVITLLEKYCNRPLKERIFSNSPTILVDNVEVANPNYTPDYCIFDGIPCNTFWFPTKPIKQIDSFSISGEVITASVDYLASSGYILYPKEGRLIYDRGFDFGYHRNIITEYVGGYAVGIIDYDSIAYLSYSLILELYNSVSDGSDNYISERIGNYSYTKIQPGELEKFIGMYPKIFDNLSYYKRVIIV